MNAHQNTIRLDAERRHYWLKLLDALGEDDTLTEAEKLDRIQRYLRTLSGQPTGWAQDGDLNTMFDKLGYTGVIHLPRIILDKKDNKHFQYIAHEPNPQEASGLIAHISNNSTSADYQRHYDSKERRTIGGTHWEARINDKDIPNYGDGSNCGYLSLAQNIIRDLPRVKAHLSLTKEKKNTVTASTIFSSPPQKKHVTSATIKPSYNVEQEVQRVKAQHQKWDVNSEKRFQDLQETLAASSASIEQLVNWYHRILNEYVEIDQKGKKDSYMLHRAERLDKEYGQLYGEHFFSDALKNPTTIAHETTAFMVRELLVNTLAREAWRNPKAELFLNDELQQMTKRYRLGT